MSKKNLVVSLIPAILSLLLVIGVMTVFSACGPKDDGTWMHCHYAQQGVAVCGGIMTLLFAVAAFVRNRVAGILLNAGALAGAAAAFLMPGTIMSMCMMQTMRCYTVMQPFARIMAVILALLALWGIIRAARSKG